MTFWRVNMQILQKTRSAKARQNSSFSSKQDFRISIICLVLNSIFPHHKELNRAPYQSQI